MTQLTTGQVKGLAQAAGFDDASSSVMTAIAFAESDGVTTKHNPIPPDDSWGLWQINMYAAKGPARRKQFGITSNSQLTNPGVNAAAARAIYNEQGYHAWSTYGGTKYRLYLNKAKAATPDTSSVTQGSDEPWYKKTIAQNLHLPGANAGAAVGSALSSAGDVAGQVSRVADAIGKTGNWLSDPTNWLRIGYITSGAVVAIFALQSLFKPVTSAAAGSVLKAASVLPSGKAAGALSKTAKVMK